MNYTYSNQLRSLYVSYSKTRKLLSECNKMKPSPLKGRIVSAIFRIINKTRSKIKRLEKQGFISGQTIKNMIEV